MTNKTAFSALVIATAALAVSLLHPTQQSAQKETAYERVIRTMTLRCGYMIAPPFISIDPNTQKLSGMNYDYTEMMAKTLGLKLTWEEIFNGQQIESMRAGRVDAICAGEAPIVATASAYLLYSEPLAYFTVDMYVHGNDMRFDGTYKDALKKANAEAVTAEFMDGDVSQDYALQLFPNAKHNELPQTAAFTQVFEDVATGKADLVIEDSFTSSDYIQHNPGKLRRAQLERTFAVGPNQMSVLRGQEALINMLSQGIQLMRQRGLEDQVLAPYERAYPNMFYRVPLPYSKPVG